MRALTAIVAAVLSVTTGGPLRCPCQLGPLLRSAAVVTPADESPRRTCSCHAHREPDSPEPATPEPGPGHPPCPHGPGIDITPPPTGGERGGDDPPVDPAAGFDLPGVGLALVAPAATSAAAGAVHPPPPGHLRYCHAFRC